MPRLFRGRGGKNVNKIFSRVIELKGGISTISLTQSKDAGLREQRPRYTEPLLLATRYVGTPPADNGIVLVRQLQHESMRAGSHAGLDDLVSRRIRTAVRHVLVHARVEEYRLLPDQSHLRTEPVDVETPYVAPPESYPTRARLVESHEQADDGTLAATAEAGDRQHLAILQREGCLTQYGLVPVRRIREFDPLEMDSRIIGRRERRGGVGYERYQIPIDAVIAAVFDGGRRIGRIRRTTDMVVPPLQKIEQPRAAPLRPQKPPRCLGQFHDGIGQVYRVHAETREVARRYLPPQNLVGPEHEHDHERRVPDEVTRPPERPLVYRHASCVSVARLYDVRVSPLLGAALAEAQHRGYAPEALRRHVRRSREYVELPSRPVSYVPSVIHRAPPE